MTHFENLSKNFNLSGNQEFTRFEAGTHFIY